MNEVMRELERRFPPEFRNRIDEVVIFSPLAHDEVPFEQVLAAVPFFLFMGYILESSGLMERLFRAFQLTMAKVSGSLYIAVTATAGSGLIYHVFDHYGPEKKGAVGGRINGVLISNAQGAAVAYAMYRLRIPGTVFVPEGASPAKLAAIRGYVNTAGVPDAALMKMAKFGAVVDDWVARNDLDITAEGMRTTERRGVVLPAGVSLVGDPEAIVCSVQAPRTEVEEAPALEEGTEPALVTP